MGKWFNPPPKEVFYIGARVERIFGLMPECVVAEAIRQANQSFKLPSIDTPKKRCKQCGHKCYETFFVGAICQGCHTREVVNEQWKGRFRV